MRIVVSGCAVSSSTALQVGKDYSACPALVDLTKGIASPEYKAWYINPTTTQQQNYTTCQADPTASVAIQKDYAACPPIVGASSAQRQYQAWYTDTTGARVNYSIGVEGERDPHPGRIVTEEAAEPWSRA